jgi:peptidoglycan/xylan/chitin deacetylase (PgdA/CDA1 family)
MVHNYFIKTPWWVKKVFSSYVWDIPTTEKIVYLSFDDGPHPNITPWVLEQLNKHNAKASFFCIGKNVLKHPSVYQQVLAEGHAIGNHTHHHLNGWKTPPAEYLADIEEASKYINSGLFRPPYGRITKAAWKGLPKALNVPEVKVIMWDVLSADFDNRISKETCVTNVLKNARPGSVVVFHDSEKAFANLQFALPLILSNLKNEGYRLEEIVMGRL